MIVLGIETSCDETSAGIVINGRQMLSNVVSSQVDIHKKFGGVVPEVASRNHLMAIAQVVDEALKASGLTKKEIDAIAVTYGAGLIGALMIGTTFAKTLAKTLGKPVIKVNHIRGHIAAAYLIDAEFKPPFLALIVSGGHTAVLEAKNYTQYKTLISTVDDAIGEVFDKVARVLELPYPGGPNLERLAGGEGHENIFKYHLPAAKEMDSFSYSGLKTSVINHVNQLVNKNELDSENKKIIARSFQQTAFLQVVSKTILLCKKRRMRNLVVCGGVSANKFLQNMLKDECDKNGIKLIVLPSELCTDNGAMIAAQGYFESKEKNSFAPDDLGASSSIPL